MFRIEQNTKGLISFTSVMDCDRTAMDLPPVKSLVFLIVMFLVKRGSLGGISELNPFEFFYLFFPSLILVSGVGTTCFSSCYDIVCTLYLYIL
jgi:hypothetical protein